MRLIANPGVRILLLAGIWLLCIGPVLAGGQIAIDPVSGDVPAGSVIVFTGTTTHPAGTTLQYGFSRQDAESGTVRYGEYSGAEGIVTVEEGTGGKRWNVPILTEGYAPADYVFWICKEGSDDKISVQVRLTAGNGTPVPTLQATQGTGCGAFESPVYVSPGGTFSVKTTPDLNTQCDILAKGAPLAITVATSSGNKVGIWITSASSVTRYTRFRMVSADGSGTAKYDLPDTAALNSGQYFIYVVDGGNALGFIPDEKDPSAYLSVDVLETGLKANEMDNPYQKFMVLLEEPVINMQEIPDAVSGTSVELSGTTNLNAGTLLDIEAFLADIARPDQPSISVTGVPVADGTDGRGTWHAVIDTASLPPGEYIVEAHSGSVQATRLMVLYDSIYDAGGSPGDGLVTMTFAVDPETKGIATETTTREAGFPAGPGILAITCFAGVVCIGAVVNTIRKK